MELDLGCGRNKKNDFIGIDINDWSKKYEEGMFIKHDLKKGIPFKDNEADEVYTANFIEHLYFEEFKFILEEINRVAKRYANITIIVPHNSSTESKEAGHILMFNSSSLREFIAPEINNRWYEKPLFIMKRKRLIFNKRLFLFWNYIIEPIINLSPYLMHFYEMTGLCNIFPAYFIEWKMINNK